MVLIIGLGIQGAKYAYKTYKKHQVEKEDRKKGIPQTGVDPSHELRHVDANTYPNQFHDGNPTAPSHRNVKQTHRRRNSSSSSISSASTAEVEAHLENNPEFQQFIKRQKQAYLHQQRILRENGGVTGLEVPLHLDAQSQPPPYEDVVAQDRPVDMSRSAVAASSPIVRRQLSYSRGDEEAFNVSPISYRNDSGVVELDSSPVSSTRSSMGVISELPGDHHNPVELPSVRV